MKRPNNPGSSKVLIEELIALGKRSAKHAFPNQKRDGCPDRALLRQMARADLDLPAKDLPISHIVACSPCFRQYTRYRQISVLFRRFQRTAPYAAALAAMLFAVLAILEYRGPARGSHGKPPGSQIASNPLHPGTSTPTQVPVTIDLAAFSSTRGVEASSEEAIHLALRPLRMTIRLPIGMEPGEYALQLRDSTGVVFADTHIVGRVTEGITSLNLDLDLSVVKEGRGALMVRPPGLSWRTFPVVFK